MIESRPRRPATIVGFVLASPRAQRGPHRVHPDKNGIVFRLDIDPDGRVLQTKSEGEKHELPSIWPNRSKSQSLLSRRDDVRRHGECGPEECIRIIHKALDAGINFIDTADAYSQGESEEIVGEALKGRRDSIIVSTKVYHPMGIDPNQQGSSRRWITRAVEDSLRRLGTDYIDLYQIHRPTPDTDIEESLSVLHGPDARG